MWGACQVSPFFLLIPARPGKNLDQLSLIYVFVTNQLIDRNLRYEAGSVIDALIFAFYKWINIELDGGNTLKSFFLLSQAFFYCRELRIFPEMSGEKKWWAEGNEHPTC